MASKKRSLSPITLFAVIPLFLSSTIYAEESNGNYITERDVFGDLPLISTVSRMDQPLHKVPASTTVIDRELIIASGAMTWVDVFRLVPGFQSYYINGNRYGIAYHGLGNEFPNHLEVTVDGRSIYSPAFSAIPWSALGLSIHDVDHIEIVRGSNAPSQGSNAFLGAINIVTIDPLQQPGTQVKVTTGDRSTREGYLSHYGLNEDWRYGAVISYRHNSGFPKVTKPQDKPDDPIGPMDDGTEQISSRLRTIYTPNLKDEYDLQLGYTKSRPGWGDVDHPDEYSRAIFKTDYQSLKWNHAFDNGDSLQLHAYHNGLDGENNNRLRMLSDELSTHLHRSVPPAEVPAYTQLVLEAFDSPLASHDETFHEQVYTHGGFNKIRTHQYDIELEHRLQLTDVLRTTWGAGYRHESIRSLSLLGHNKTERLNSARLFTHTEWSLTDRLILNGGVMLENNKIVNTIGSARGGVNFSLTDHHTLRASIARGARSPSIVEDREFNADVLYSDTGTPLVVNAIRLSDPGVEEEHLTSYEFGYIGNFPKQRLSIELQLFREEIRDGLEVYPAPTVERFFFLEQGDTFNHRNNTADWDMSGVELQVKYRPTDKTLIFGHYGYRTMDGKRVRSYQPTRRYRDIDDYGPRHTANLLLSQKLTNSLTASLNTYHISEADWRDGNEVDGFTRVDAQLRWELGIGDSKGALSLIGQNLGGDYTEHGLNNVFDTRVYIKMELELP